MKDEYIRRQDAVDAFEDTTFTKNEIRRRLLDIKPADVVPVVRCRDCRYRVDPDKCCHPDGLLRSKDSDFCSYGKRKE